MLRSTPSLLAHRPPEPRLPRSAARRASRAPTGLLLGLLAGLGLMLPGAAPPAEAESKLPRSERPEDAHLYFITPFDGERVTSPVVVRFGLAGMGVAPAGVAKPNTGHHHLIIDAPLPPSGLPIPNDATHRHFGGGQTQVTLDLEPGTHRLQLVLGDHLHIPHDPPVTSEAITITVVAPEQP